MDANKRITLLQLKGKMWEEVLLYDGLRKGPETKNAQGEINWGDEKWSQTLKRLDTYLADKANQPRLVRELFLGEIDKDWTRDKYVNEVRKVCKEISNYNEQPGQPEDLQNLGKHLYKILAQQSGRGRTEEELLRDFNNAGQLEPHPTRSVDKGYMVTDHHGRKQWLPKIFLPESLHWSMDQILADNSNEGRPFKSDHCVRLKTDRYAGRGMPEGIEGYVLGAVSNKHLGWEANLCQVMFIVACTSETTEQDKITVWDDFLEVTDDDLQLCDKKHPPSLWFPFQVDGDGRVIRDQRSGLFEYHTKITPYRYPELWDVLTAQQRQPGEGLQEEEEGNPSPSLGVKKPYKKGWNRIKSLWRKGKKGVRNGNQNISKKLKQEILSTNLFSRSGS